jgi:hypothetical protein
MAAFGSVRRSSSSGRALSIAETTRRTAIVVSRSILGASAPSEQVERLGKKLRALMPALSPQRIEYREHRTDLCELPIHVRDL